MTTIILPKLYKEEDLEPLLNEMYKNIKETLVKCIINDKFEFKYMESFGLTPRQRIDINYILNSELNKLTNNEYEEWCNNIHFHITNSIASSLNSLVLLKKIEDFSPEEMVEFIYNIIVYQINDFQHSPCISEDLLINLE